MKKLRYVLTCSTILVLLQCSKPSESLAQGITFAKDLYAHNLRTKALEEFIGIFHNLKSTPNEKSEALYYMGQIPFDDNNYSTAFNDWERLIRDYPNSSRALEIKERLTQLREVIAKVSNASITSITAQIYFNNGDFWSEVDKKFMIDPSWLPRFTMALEWYDRVIAEFPKSEAADIAYQKKLFTLIGWKETGYGVRGNFTKYMPVLLKTFVEFETAFPNSPYLQGFRYSIAQAYWWEKDWANTRIWLNKVIEAAKGQVTFYTETAKARLTKIEH